MILDPNQQQALQRGETAEATENGITFVMVWKDLFEELQANQFDPRDHYEASLRALGEDGMEDH